MPALQRGGPISRMSHWGPQQHLLGISLEDYFHVGAFRNLIAREHWRRFESRLERATDATLDLLDAYQARATFFTLGWVAEHLPELVRRVVERGHEVANSGFSHSGISELGPSELRDELERGRAAIAASTGLPPRGTRIPDWIREDQLWALDVVADLGYEYDASLRPLGRDCRRHPERRFPFVHRRGGRDLHEFPVPTTRIGPLLVPIGGGNWIRQLPEPMVTRAVERWQRSHGVPFSIYCQSWELDPAQPRITGASWIASMRHYRNLDHTERFLRRFLAKGQFVAYAEYLGLPTQSRVPPTQVQRRTRESIVARGPRVDAPSVPVTVVVPCFNEADTLPYLLNTLASVGRKLAPRYRLSYVFVDDGSHDDTWAVLQALVGAREDCQVVRHEVNQGIARAILRGIAAAPDEFVCSIDADCTYDPNQLADLLPVLEAGADLVTASPYHPDGQVRRVPRWRLMLSRTLSRMYSRQLGSSLHTYTSCFRAYRRSRFAGLSIDHNGFLGIAEILARAVLGGARVAEVPATLEVRLLGQSKLKVLPVIAGHLRLLRELGALRGDPRASVTLADTQSSAEDSLMREVGIVGGGMLGLTLALRLAQRGHRVTVFESESVVGGLASADAIGDMRWDRFYHVVLARDHRLLALLNEIGLGEQTAWASTRTGFYVDGRWHSMSSALDFLRFPPLSLGQKVRLGLTLVGASRLRDWRSLEQVTAVDWLTKWSGRRTVEAIWLPLLRSKLGANAESASAAFIWAIIVRMYGARGAGTKRETMGYVRGGYDRILAALRHQVEAAGVCIVTGARVATVRSDHDGARLTLQDGSTHEVGNAVLTVSCPRVAAMCPDLTAAERARLQRVVYQGVVCPSFLLRRPLSGYYVTNITAPDIPFTGVIEMSALVDPAAFGGRHLVYLPMYLTQDDSLWRATDDAIADRCFVALQRMVPGLSDDDVVARRVARARDVLAISTLRYSTELMPPVRSSLPRVFVANSAQIPHGTLNVDETIALAERSAATLDPMLVPSLLVPQHG